MVGCFVGSAPQLHACVTHAVTAPDVLLLLVLSVSVLLPLLHSCWSKQQLLLRLAPGRSKVHMTSMLLREALLLSMLRLLLLLLHPKALTSS